MAKPRSKLIDGTIGAITVGLLSAIKRMDRKRTANFAGAFLRTIGPLLPENRIGRENLRSAFPDKSDAEIEKLLAGVWDNLGRIAVEFAHLDEFCIEGTGPQTFDVITHAPEAVERYGRMLESGKPMLGFGAHLANWELPGVVAKALVPHSAVLYRRPNIRPISDVIVKLRAPLMGDLVATGIDAPVKLARLLESGVHVGMLVDQHFSKGVDVIFFGRRCRANPLIAMIARQTECPIHGLRVVRKPDGNSFWVEITGPIDPVRDADGRVDINGTMQTITSGIEGWVREQHE
jgi:Kdo2-lipid IVA lauroyltransferase/acyltransferase